MVGWLHIDQPYLALWRGKVRKFVAIWVGLPDLTDGVDDVDLEILPPGPGLLRLSLGVV